MMAVHLEQILKSLEGRIMDLSLFTCRNTVLKNLPQLDFKTVIHHCKLVQLQPGEVVNDTDMNIETIFFPIDCIISLVYESFNGKATEIASIGNDGVMGSEICLNENPSKFTAITTHAGWAYRMKKSAFLEQFNNLETFRYNILNYLQNQNTQIAYTGICNKLHKLEQQYCKFLLLCKDWVQGELLFTQEKIAYVLGVRRESITDTAMKLSNAEIIDYQRGKIQILNPQALETHSCECYHAIKSTLKYENVIPQTILYKTA
ncbi:Crp/Fnr family transcriptional regulator [Nitrosomonas ureae]|nr:Crp/Fnr family transcriptional regulator [Nitrosomonas ureae]